MQLGVGERSSPSAARISSLGVGGERVRYNARYRTLKSSTCRDAKGGENGGAVDNEEGQEEGCH